MKLSPPFARNADDMLQLCLNEQDQPVLVSDEFVELVKAPVFDNSLVIRAHPTATSWVVPVFDGPHLHIDLNKYIVNGGYVVRVGWTRFKDRRIIVVRGELDKLPPVDANQNIT